MRILNFFPILISTLLLSHLLIYDYPATYENAHLHEFEKEDVCYTDIVNEELPSVQYSGMMIVAVYTDISGC